MNILTKLVIVTDRLNKTLEAFCSDGEKPNNIAKSLERPHPQLALQSRM